MTDILRTSLLHASGKPMVMLGGDVFSQKKVGDMVIEHKWVDGEPVMILYKRVLGSNTPAYMIEMSDAHKYLMSNGHATKALIGQLCMGAAMTLGVEHDRNSITRIIDAIVEGVDIMLCMPPEPKEIEIANRPSTGNDELTLKIDGKVVAEVVL